MADFAAVARRHQNALIAAGICAVLLIAFWVRAQVAISGKSATYDEPIHSLGAWIHWHYGDWRINYEDPPLWHYWAALANGENTLKVDFQSPEWILMAESWERQWSFAVKVLYQTPGNDGEAFIQRSRSMMIVIGVLVGAVIAWWSFRSAGIIAAVAGVIMFSLDPNFLGHSALVKNDVSMALCTVCLCMALWRMGRRMTPWNLLGAAAACGCAMATKFSGALLAPAFVVAILAARVVLPFDWQVFKFGFKKWWQRLLAALGAASAIGLFSYATIWVAYGMTFEGLIEPRLRMNTQYIMDQAHLFSTKAKFGNIDEATLRDPQKVEELNKRMAEAYNNWQPDSVLRTLNWMLDHRLFPEAWLNGLMFVQARSYVRGSFLDGERSIVGFRSYFPYAMAYKTPLASIFAIAGATGFAIFLLTRHVRSKVPRDRSSDFWTGGAWLAICVILPVAIYMAVSINSNLNIGFRHVLPIYPLMYVGVATAIAAACKRWQKFAMPIAGALAAGIAVESFAIAPDYITFFNVAAGGQRGGLYHLGDSNLDWGQDLPLLKKYMDRPENRDVTLYLCYFGVVDPQFYGIRYLNMPAGYMYNPQTFQPSPGSIVAISATKLQQVYKEPGLDVDQYFKSEPTAVLGGTIYIFDLRKPLKPKVGQ